MKILVVSPDYPYPPNHGGRVDVLRRLEILNKLNHEVDLISTVKQQPLIEEISHVNQLVNSQLILMRSNKILDHLKLEPYQVVSRECLKKIEFDTHYDWIFIEGDYVYKILENPTLKASKIFIRVNNNESKYFLKLSLASIPKPSFLYYLLDAIKFNFFSYRIYKKANLIGFVSSDELKAYSKRRESNSNVQFQLLSHYDITKFKECNETQNRNVLFVGSLFMPNNLNGLDWYIRRIHNYLLESYDNYKLTIVGSTQNNVSLKKKLIQKFSNIKNVELHLDIPNLESYYNSSQIFINPMFKGAGIKVKTLNAMQNGLPVVSTVVGAEGLGLVNEEHAFITNNPDTFIEYIQKLLNSVTLRKKIVDSSQKHLIGLDAENLFNNYLINI